jgi:hypothetical protein
MSHHCCHEGYGCEIGVEDQVHILQQTKKILQIRIEAIDRRISQLKEQETEAGS